MIPNFWFYLVVGRPFAFMIFGWAGCDIRRLEYLTDVDVLAADFSREGSTMSTEIIILIVVLILVFGGGGFYWSRRR